MTRIGKYEIRAELGHDAFTRTFRAFDPDAARPVTVLVLTERADQQRRTSFRTDAAAAANIHHRNVVAIYELGEHEGLSFIAMQSVEGEDLRQVIAKRKSLTQLQKMLLMSEVAQALQAAHRGGILHVGVRPAGIILLEAGSARIVEFGAVRSLRLTNGSGQRGEESEALYLSPEEVTNSAPPDALSDIFTYGIIYYELLTGVHPFASTDPRDVRSKIVHQDPAPLRTLAPGCPDAMEEIVRRALQKDRELRYQSFDDAQWDAEPILQELKRERAAALLSEGRRLVEEEDLDRAQVVVREALTLVPGNRAAERLRETVRDQMQRRVIRSRLDALLQQAENEVAARHFADAVQILESGLRLDSTDASVRSRLEETRGLLERAQKAAALVDEARRLLDDEDLPAAHQKASEALDQDPQSDTARQLLDQLEEQQEKGKRAAAVRQTLEEVQWLVEQDRPDLAVQLLRQNFTAYPEAAELGERLAVAEIGLRDWERRRFLHETLARVTELERRQQWRTALTVLQEATQTYPDAAEFAGAAERLRGQLDENERRRKLARRLEIIRQKITEQAWNQALSLVEISQKDFPEERGLDDLRAQAHAGQQRAECENVIAGFEQCLADGELEQAEEMLRKALVLSYGTDGAVCYPGENRLQALQEALGREKVFRNRWREAEVLFGRGQLPTAEKILLELADRKPENPEVQALLETIRSGRTVAEEEQFYNRGRAKALGLMEEQQLDQAADLLRNLLTVFPNDPILERDLQSAISAREQRGATSLACEPAPRPASERSFSQDAEAGTNAGLQAGLIAPPFTVSRPATTAASWRRPAVLTMGVFLLVASAAVPVWRFSRKQHSVAMASPAPERAKPAVQEPKAPYGLASPIPAARPAASSVAEPTPIASKAGKKPAAPDTRRPLQAFNGWRASAPSRPGLSIAPPPAGIEQTAASVPSLPGAIVAPVAPAVAPPPVVIRDEGPPAAKPERTRVGGEFRDAQLLSGPNVTVPPLARERRVYGAVRLEATISKEGTVKNVVILSGHAMLVEVARQAILARRYSPAMLNGEPVEVKMPIQVVFEPGR